MENKIIGGSLDIKTLKNEYLEYIDVANKTVQTYDIALKQFAKYLKANNIVNPTREDIIAYRDSLRLDHSIATVNSYLIAIRNFFDYLEYKGLYKNIAKRIKGLKDTDLHKREALSVEDCQKVYNNAKNLREKAIFILLLSCGLRANELVNVRLEDFKKVDGVYRLYVLGKGRDGKTDYVVVPKETIDVLKEYVNKYNIIDYLFVSQSHNNTGGKLSTYTIRTIVNEMYERVGIKSDTIVVHSLRHSFATISLRNGEDIRSVSKAMRHKNTVVTERYAHDLEVQDNKCSTVVINSLLGGK